MSIGDPSSAEVEREAESERADLVNTLGQLRENLKPANMVDEMMSSANISPADITDRVWRTARNNPIPAALIGIGAAMLLGVGQKVKAKRETHDSGLNKTKRVVRPGDYAAALAPEPRSRVQTVRRAAGESVHAVKDRINEKLDDLGAQASTAASRISDSVGDLQRQAKDKLDHYASSARKGIRPSGNTMDTYARSRDQIASNISKILDEQPLVLAALGVAVGAAIGAAFPTTETESQLMGDTSSSVKQAAQSLAQDQYAQLKATAGQTLDQIKQSATEHGVSKENFTGLVQDVGGVVRDAAVNVAGHAAEPIPGRV